MKAMKRTWALGAAAAVIVLTVVSLFISGTFTKNTPATSVQSAKPYCLEGKGVLRQNSVPIWGPAPWVWQCVTASGEISQPVCPKAEQVSVPPSPLSPDPRWTTVCPDD